MDYMTSKYKNAQILAEKIITMKKGNYLSCLSSDDIHFDCNSYRPSISKWFQITGFRKNSDRKSTIEHLNRAVREWVRSTNGSGSDAVYGIVRDQGVTSIVYGANYESIDALFKANISDCRINASECPAKGYKFNGLFTGTYSSEGLSDALVSSGIHTFYVTCSIIPVADDEVFKIIENDRKNVDILSEYKAFSRVYGNASRRTEEIHIPAVMQAITLLNEEIEYLQANIGKGFARAIVQYGAETEKDFKLLSSIIQSCFVHEDSKGYEPVRKYLCIKDDMSYRDFLLVPHFRFNANQGSLDIHALTLQCSESIVSFCIPPILSCEGFYVRDYNVDEDSVDVFSLPEKNSSEVITIGNIADHCQTAIIPLQAFLKHALVAGSTGSGKTTTVKRMLAELHDKGIPFTVIEAAKKEYFTLASKIPELQVYTAGSDGKMLSFNPLQPEDGVLIENHAAAVVRALIASTGGEHPIPEAYSGLLKQTYSKFGWEYGQMAYTDEYKPFPTFKDVFDNVESYISAHAAYGPEVRQNLSAALALRAETMHSGALGKAFDCRFGIKASDLLEHPSVIELADFSHEAVTFVMNILLFKFQCYLSRKPHSDQLNRVIVIEEAHNVFKKSLDADYGSALNNNYFDKMFSEVRSSGTGLILSDQRPGIMTDTVIANTAVKVIHALREKSDIDVSCDSLNMSRLQSAKVREFDSGECVISIDGKYGLQHTYIRALDEHSITNAACLVCSNRFRCKKEAVRAMFGVMNPAMLEYYVTKIGSNPYNIPVLEANISEMLEKMNVTASSGTKLCFLGEAMHCYGKIPIQEGRVIAKAYYESLVRGGA